MYYDFLLCSIPDLGLGEDWEQDFDVEITEEDLKAAEDIAKRLGENLDDNASFFVYCLIYCFYCLLVEQFKIPHANNWASIISATAS